MSDQFYSYISEKIINFFINEEIHKGEKFYVEFDNEIQVLLLYDQLKEYSDINEKISTDTFEFQYENGNPFESYCIKIPKKCDIVIADSYNTNMDYLVTLRNEVPKQKDNWNNKSLLIIGHDIKDSIKSGMKNLENEGLPLNFKSISKNLNQEINEYDIPRIDREIIKFAMKLKKDERYKPNLWDYEDILSLINQRKVTDEDLKNIGLFSDKGLDELNSQNIQKRLMENHQVYSLVYDYNQYDNPSEKLSKKYDSRGTELLSSKNWENTDYTTILKHNDITEGNSNFKELKINKDMKFWIKGKQTKDIIIFNKNEESTLDIQLKFDDKIDESFIKGKNKKIASKKSNNTILLNFDVYNTSVRFIRVSYAPDKGKKYNFNIAVVNCDESIFTPIKHKYQVIATKGKDNTIEIISEDNEPIKIGMGTYENSVEINENGQEVYINENETIVISDKSLAWSENKKLMFNLLYNSYSIPFSIKEEQNRINQTSSLNIWNLKRENKENFKYYGSKVIQGVNSFYLTKDFKQFLDYEKQIILNNILHGNIDIDNNIKRISLNLPDTIEEKYLKILEYYKNLEDSDNYCGYPSLVYIDSNLEKLYEEFLNEYNNEIETITENKPLSSDKSKLDLNKIGILKDNNTIYFTSLSPINMAYQLEVKKQLNNEKLDINILKRINNHELVPYIYNFENELYKPSPFNDVKEWIKYEKEENVSIGSTNQFITKVIKEKINEFIENFNYLFISNNKAPIKLNIINIKQDENIVKGIFKFLNERFDKGKDIIPIELNLYNNASKSSFDDFFTCENEEDLINKFDLKISSKNIDKDDVLRDIQNNITYYKNENNPENYEYAHISFYKLGEKTESANHPMDDIETGITLNGLISNPTSFNSESGYRIGFGTKHLPKNHNLLIRTVINTNELAQNNKNKGNDSYIKKQTIVSQPFIPNEEEIENLYEKSLWITFIEPSFGLEYFDNSKNIIIIHYSDQYTSSNKYDTITVTDKNKQYKNILKNFLIKKEIQTNEDQLNNVIKIFNGINGNWLLRSIKDNNPSDQEKLSIISAIKYMYGLLNDSDIVWIPISMEEILRIAGTVGLSKTEGLFRKSLLKGKLSDDLLFLGINIKEDNIKVYYYPVEVKEGLVPKNTITKGEEQLTNTIKLINSQLKDNNTFQNKFYRNFFMQLALANLNKLKKLDFWSDSKLNKIEEIKPLLFNDEYEVSDELIPYIGKGSVVTFKVNLIESKVNYDEDKQIIEMPDEYAFNALIKTNKEIYDQIINRSEFKPNDLLSNKLENNIVNPQFKDLLIDSTNPTENMSNTPSDTSQDSANIISTQTNGTTDDELENPETNNNNTNTENKIKKHEEIVELNDVRALIGLDGNSETYWEYGNKDLSNRHLLILGKSGFGKTYFIQCLIKEMSKQDIPTLIIDYSDAFMSKEIQDELKEYLGDNLIKYNIKKEQFPLNPFRKNKVEYDEDDYYYEDNLDIASRIKSVFSSVYNLGIVQENTLVRAINNGLEKYAENMSFDYLMEELDDPENKNALSILNQLNEFLLFNPFQQESEFEWSELDERSKKVIIIQLHGYSRDIQKIITEFILWDLWNYKSLHGSEDKPFNVILDEAQNLDYKDDSPCIKILKEGRKKGWSVWFATQSIKGLMKNTEVNPFNNANQTIYFHPADNVKNIAGEFTTNNQDKNYWAEKLASLKKGECISVGPVINMDGNLNSSKPKYLSITPLSNR